MKFQTPLWWRCCWRGHNPAIVQVWPIYTHDVVILVDCRRCGAAQLTFTSLVPDDFFASLRVLVWLLPPPYLARLNQRLLEYMRIHSAELLQPSTQPTPGALAQMYPLGDGHLKFKVRRTRDAQVSVWHYTYEPELYLVTTQVRALLPAVLQFFHHDFNLLEEDKQK